MHFYFKPPQFGAQFLQLILEVELAVMARKIESEVVKESMPFFF